MLPTQAMDVKSFQTNRHEYALMDRILGMSF